MILAKIIQHFMKLKKFILSSLYSKFLLKSNGKVTYYSTPFISHPQNIFIGKGTIIYKDVTLFASKEKNSLTVGENCIIHPYTIIKVTKGRIVIGNYSSLNSFSMIVSNGDITIGNFVRIGPQTLIISSNHNYKNTDITIYEQGVDGKGIVISDNVWIGSGVKILDGVRIGSGSVIGAGAVVTRNVPQRVLVGGVPAKIIKEI